VSSRERRRLPLLAGWLRGGAISALLIELLEQVRHLERDARDLGPFDAHAGQGLIVVVGGQVQQLQAGDSIASPITISQTNDEAGAVVIGQAVYNDVAGGVKKAQANAAATQKVLGLVSDVTVATGQPVNVQTSDILTATTVQWDAVTAQSGGLTPNTDYFLDPAAPGRLTTTATSTTGQYLRRVGYALSTVDMDIRVDPTSILM
jgi:hypothetical protein